MSELCDESFKKAGLHQANDFIAFLVPPGEGATLLKFSFHFHITTDQENGKITSPVEVNLFNPFKLGKYLPGARILPICG